MSVVARMRRAREQAGLSVRQAERIAGVDIWAIERGTVVPTPAHLATLADIYGVSFAWLSDGTETQIDEATERAIRDADIYPSDRARLRELLSTRPAKPAP